MFWAHTLAPSSATVPLTVTEGPVVASHNTGSAWLHFGHKNSTRGDTDPLTHGTLMGHFLATIHIVCIDHHLSRIGEAALNQ